MKLKHLLVTVPFAVLILAGTVSLTVTVSAALQSFTLYGYVRVLTPDQSTMQAQTAQKPQTGLSLLTVKLQYPKERGKPDLVTYPNSAGAFSFASLPADNYLLRIHSGYQLLYEKKIRVESDVFTAIPLGNLKPVDKITVQKRKTAVLTGQEFQKRVAISVGDIDLRKDGNKLAVTVGPAGTDGKLIPKSRPFFSGSLPSSMLIAGFRYNNQNYTLAGAIRRSAGQEYFDCEIYR